MKATTFLLGLGLATQAGAGGIDRSGQPISFLFSEGTVVELGFGRVAPQITGTDAGLFGGFPTGDIAPDFSLASASFRFDLSDRLSFGLIVDHPFGAEAVFAPSSLAFAGTFASAETTSVTTLLRYRLGDRISVHGGPRWQEAQASFHLQGALYGPFSGYSAEMARDQSMGYVVGAAFEIPEYFIRAALTYNSAIGHRFTTTETAGALVLTNPVTMETPQSLNFEFTAGVAPETFVFGGARWVDWSELAFSPPILAGSSPDPLVDFNDTVTYSLGLGRRFSDHWTGLASVVYEPGTGPLTAPLTPTDGFYGASLGAIYSMDGFQVQANVTATALGDATPYVSALGTTVSRFSDNRSLAFGLKLVQTF